MLNHDFAFRSGRLAGGAPRGVAQRFTPTLEDIQMSIDGKALMPSHVRPDRPSPFESEPSR